MTTEELIDTASRLSGENTRRAIRGTLDACEELYLHGFPDEVTGDVDSPTGHVYRIDRWIVTTDSYGFHEIDEYEVEADAKIAFEGYDYDFERWEGNDD